MEEHQIYTRKQIKTIAILVPLVGILIAMAYGMVYEYGSIAAIIIDTIGGIISTGIIWIGCSLIVAFLWHKYPWEKHPAKHLILEIILIFLYVLLFGLLTMILDKYVKIYPNYAKDGPEIADFFISLLITYFITTLHEAVFFYKQWKYNFSKSTRLEKDNIEAKYETLKSQINPHFLFNSLNSLSLIVDDNTEATHYIQNLSEFLRYVLTSRDHELVLVRDEIQILEKYFSLQKSRFRDNLIINLNVDEKFYHYSLPPLVLQMLSENCIKHNIISKDKPLTINIFVEKESIIVENKLQKKNTEISTKQGLRNITDRFSFFTTREVKISESTNTFRVEIPLLKVEI